MDEQYYQYRTGRTEPKKSHRGPISLLLILVIFLCGIISAMGLFNIRMTLWLNKTAPSRAPLSFSQVDTDNAESFHAPGSEELSVKLGGMTCQELSVLCRNMYGLPEGVYIAHVEDGSPADGLGIVPGDVLVSFGGTPVSGLEALQNLLDSYAAGTGVEVITYRNGKQSTLILHLNDG